MLLLPRPGRQTKTFWSNPTNCKAAILAGTTRLCLFVKFKNENMKIQDYKGHTIIGSKPCVAIGKEFQDISTAQMAIDKKLIRLNCDHSYVPIGDYSQTGRFACLKCNHQI